MIKALQLNPHVTISQPLLVAIRLCYTLLRSLQHVSDSYHHELSLLRQLAHFATKKEAENTLRVKPNAPENHAENGQAWNEPQQFQEVIALVSVFTGEDFLCSLSLAEWNGNRRHRRISRAFGPWWRRIVVFQRLVLPGFFGGTLL